MGCNIYSFAEKLNKITGRWEKVEDAFTLSDYDKKRTKEDKGSHPFCWRSYSLFGFLAGVRNVDHCEPLSEPKGVPKDVCAEIRGEYEWCGDVHSLSFFTVKDLLDFDYEKTFLNRREGELISYRDNLGEMYFTHLGELKVLGEPDEVRIVFWFD